MSRRLGCILAIVSIGLTSGWITSAPPAWAGKPAQINEHRIGFVCDEPPLIQSAGTVIAGADLSDTEGPSAFALYWAAPSTPETDEPTLRSTTDVPQVSVDGYHIEAIIPMETSLGVPAGSATIVAHLMNAGDTVYGETEHAGNVLIRDRTVVQPLVVVSGSLTLPDGATFDLARCSGGDLNFDIFITNPDAFVQSFAGVLVVCDIETEDYSFHLAASAEESGVGAEIVFSDAAGTIGGISADFTLTPEVFEGTIDVRDFETDQSAGTAVIDVTFARGDRMSVTLSEAGQRSKITGWMLEATGTVTIPTDPVATIDVTSCFALEGREQRINTSPGSPGE